ncbi:CopD family protein [Bacillus gobiensis]|uniref:copper resistance D family protein n=1 Tax=Bacillus gobiensis TaxID=1441095 RepID=UPI003D237CDA
MPDLFVSLADFFVYLLLSFLVGHIFLTFIPEAKKPLVQVPEKLLLASPLLIAILTIGPILKLSLSYSKDFGFYQAFFTVLTDLRSGQAWMMTVIICLCVWLFRMIKAPNLLQLLFLFALIFVFGYGGHSASISPVWGIVNHVLHFTGAVLWVGILLNVGWFGEKEQNWSAFLNWFTPLAAGCLVLMITSGLFLMSFVMNIFDYANAFPLSYGQYLFIKHIGVLAVIAFAIVNGGLASYAKSNRFRVLHWIRAETVILGVVFFFTSFLGTQSPPHNIGETLSANGESFLFRSFKGTASIPVQADFSVSIAGVVFALMSISFLALFYISFFRNGSAKVGLLFCFLVMISFYLAAMNSFSFS